MKIRIAFSLWLVACTNPTPPAGTAKRQAGESCSATQICGSGLVCIVGVCEKICNGNNDCADNEFCADTHTCKKQLVTADPPVITKVEGTGTNDGSGKRLRDRLVVLGKNLGGATFELKLGANRTELTRCEAGTDLQVTVALPASVSAGLYTLTAES